MLCASYRAPVMIQQKRIRRKTAEGEVEFNFVMHYEPFHADIDDLQAHAIRAVLSTCIPCNIMCMRTSDTTHIRYHHGTNFCQYCPYLLNIPKSPVHRICDHIVSVSLRRRRRLSEYTNYYYVVTTDPSRLTSVSHLCVPAKLC